MVSENSRRIAKNTILLYIRTIFSQLIALYTSRKILEVLGIDDFGIQSVVGGVVSMLTFLNGSMAIATQRYLTIELGKNDLEAYNKVFSMAVMIHAFLALLIFIAAETFGLWFVNYQLNIPADRMVAANFVYQATIIMVVIGIIQTPYMSSIVAHERMDIFAYAGMGESVARLLIVFALSLIAFDKLITYSFLGLLVSVVLALIYRIFCVTKFEECKFIRQWDASLFRSMLGFTGWNMFGTIAWILKDQGNNMLMNIFGSPAINAARSVSYQVANAARNLVSGFSTAVNPQLTKNYAAENTQALHRLIMSSSKISFFLLFCVALPLLFEIRYVLDLWLVETPLHTEQFTRIILIESLWNTLDGPIITSLLATGRIKWYQIIVGSFMLLSLPVAYVLLRIGLPIITPIYVSLGIIVSASFIRLIFCKRMLSMNIRKYIFRVIVPILTVSAMAPIIPMLVYNSMPEGLLRLVVICIVSVASVCAFAFAIGLNGVERKIAINLVGQFTKRFCK